MEVELARIIGINIKSISRYELGASIPPASALNAIADALSVSADVLLNVDNFQIKDKEIFKKFEIIQTMSEETKKNGEGVIFLI